MRYYHDTTGENLILIELEGAVDLDTVTGLNEKLSKDFASGKQYTTIAYMQRDAFITSKDCFKAFSDFARANESSYKERMYIGFQGLHKVFLKSYIALAKPTVPLNVYNSRLELENKRGIKIPIDFELVAEF